MLVYPSFFSIGLEKGVWARLEYVEVEPLAQREKEWSLLARKADPFRQIAPLARWPPYLICVSEPPISLLFRLPSHLSFALLSRDILQREHHLE